MIKKLVVLQFQMHLDEIDFLDLVHLEFYPGYITEIAFDIQSYIVGHICLLVCTLFVFVYSF